MFSQEEKQSDMKKESESGRERPVGGSAPLEGI